jgi:hypothetical protein
MRRDEGAPMKEIASRLRVSPASVHLWTRDIELTPEQTSRIKERARAASSVTFSALFRDRRREYQEEGRRRARQGDALHRAGCMLYWAEGSKERNVVIFCNSDVNMVAFFSRFLSESLGVEPEKITLRLNVYTNNGLSIDEIENHWLGATKLPRSSLRRHSLNHYPTSSSGRKKNKLPYGTCSLAVFSSQIVQHIYGAIQEYGGFEEPRWLD